VFPHFQIACTIVRRIIVRREGPRGYQYFDEHRKQKLFGVEYLAVIQNLRFVGYSHVGQLETLFVGMAVDSHAP
jgi:hypothetical protein